MLKTWAIEGKWTSEQSEQSDKEMASLARIWATLFTNRLTNKKHKFVKQVASFLTSFKIRSKEEIARSYVMPLITWRQSFSSWRLSTFRVFIHFRASLTPMASALLGLNTLNHGKRLAATRKPVESRKTKPNPISCCWGQERRQH